MVFVACGLNHKTAPLSLRERFAVTADVQQLHLSQLTQTKTVNEAILLSTCNRTELYCEVDKPEVLAQWFADTYHIDSVELIPHLYTYQDIDAIRHIIRVACGLDSMMLGEPQILGQMKSAYQQACDNKTVHAHLRHAFQYIFNASKRVRTQSGIGRNPTSIAYASVQLMTRLYRNMSGVRVLVIGSGETSALVAKYLRQNGVSDFTIASRSIDKTERLAQEFCSMAVSITDIHNHLKQADVIISATSCPLPFINEQMVAEALEARNQAPMFFLDLAVPRDIECAVGLLEHVHLYNIDDMQSIVAQGMDERRAAAVRAEQLIDLELHNYLRSYRSRQADELICDYRTQMQHLAQQELQRALQQLSAGHCQHQVLSQFSERLVNKLTHQPTVGLKQVASDGREELLDLAHYLLTSSNNYLSHNEEIA